MANLPDDPAFGSQTIDFEAVAVNYLFDYEKVNLTKQSAKVTLLQLPSHGQLTGGDTYKPARGFFDGQDQVSALVELGGYQVKVIYFIKVQPEGTGGIPNDNDELIKKFCGPKGRVWKISTTTPALQSLIGDNSGFVADASPYLLNSFAVTFGDLTGTAVGTTTGQGPTAQITLDTTAAGHGWYVAPPDLPTSSALLSQKLVSATPTQQNTGFSLCLPRILTTVPQSWTSKCR
ncbi:hypothetical protein [Rhodoferax lithotrophicus]|nr:hypothetical protein [Rhodoferax sp. MIZ03]